MAWPLIIVIAIALIFALGPLVIGLEAVFSAETRDILHGQWKEMLSLSGVAWLVIAGCLCLIFVLHL